MQKARYKHLTYEQRCQIYALKKSGHSLCEIATELGVHKSLSVERSAGILVNEGTAISRHSSVQANDASAPVNRKPK